MGMSGHRWGAEGPPSEAYGRVTQPERFAPLHRIGADVLARLEKDFDVERVETHALDPELERDIVLASPSVRLAPPDRDSAPILMVCSSFPGLRVRFGRWCTIAFPPCGCDACDETAEGEARHLAWLVDNRIAGRFRETIHLDLDRASTKWTFWSDTARTEGEWPLDLEQASRLLTEGGSSSYHWRPWSIRRQA
jgi:Family of unknown function (DUF6226)